MSIALRIPLTPSLSSARLRTLTFGFRPPADMDTGIGIGSEVLDVEPSSSVRGARRGLGSVGTAASALVELVLCEWW